MVRRPRPLVNACQRLSIPWTALHVAAAVLVGADELVTTEKPGPGRNITRTVSLPVVSITAQEDRIQRREAAGWVGGELRVNQPGRRAWPSLSHPRPGPSIAKDLVRDFDLVVDELGTDDRSRMTGMVSESWRPLVERPAWRRRKWVRAARALNSLRCTSATDWPSRADQVASVIVG